MPTVFLPVEVSDDVYASLFASLAKVAATPDAIAVSSNANPTGEFVRHLTDSCQQVVLSIAIASRTPGNPISRTIIAQQTGQRVDQLTGIFGTIGRHWAATFNSPNPFIGRRIAPSSDVFYAIDRELAEQLIIEIQADADRWRSANSPLFARPD